MYVCMYIHIYIYIYIYNIHVSDAAVVTYDVKRCGSDADMSVTRRS